MFFFLRKYTYFSLELILNSLTRRKQQEQEQSQWKKCQTDLCSIIALRSSLASSNCPQLESGQKHCSKVLSLYHEWQHLRSSESVSLPFATVFLDCSLCFFFLQAFLNNGNFISLICISKQTNKQQKKPKTKQESDNKKGESHLIL